MAQITKAKSNFFDALDKVETERQFQTAIVQYSFSLGWKNYYAYDSGAARSRRSSRGFPDLVLWHPNKRFVLFVELKLEKGILSKAQKKSLGDLNQAGALVRLWKPKHKAIICRSLEEPENYFAEKGELRNGPA